jgi:ferredoxin
MFCGYCEEACPTGAIVLRREFALADYSRKSLIYTQDRLLEPAKPHVIVRDDQGDANGPRPPVAYPVAQAQAAYLSVPDTAKKAVLRRHRRGKDGVQGK